MRAIHTAFDLDAWAVIRETHSTALPSGARLIVSPIVVAVVAVVGFASLAAPLWLVILKPA